MQTPPLVSVAAGQEQSSTAQSQHRYVKGWGEAWGGLDGRNESNYRMKGKGRERTRLVWSKSLEGFKAGTARSRQKLIAVQDTQPPPRRTRASKWGKRQGIGLFSWLRVWPRQHREGFFPGHPKYHHDTAFLGAGTPGWLFMVP